MFKQIKSQERQPGVGDLTERDQRINVHEQSILNSSNK